MHEVNLEIGKLDKILYVVDKIDNIRCAIRMQGFRLTPPCTGDLHSSGVLGSVGRCLVSDVSGHPIGPIFMGTAGQVECLKRVKYLPEFFLDCLSLNMELNGSSRRVGEKLPNYAN
jgi:hypothetical protein